MLALAGANWNIPAAQYPGERRCIFLLQPQVTCCPKFAQRAATFGIHLGFRLGQARPCFLVSSPEPNPQPCSGSAHISIGSAQLDCGSLVEFDKKTISICWCCDSQEGQAAEEHKWF